MTISTPTVGPIDTSLITSAFRANEDVVPLAYREAETFTAMLERLMRWTVFNLIPYLNTNFEDIQESWVNNVTNFVDVINQGLNEQTADNVAKISQALTDIANSSVTITDPAMLAALEAAQSQTLAWLDNRYNAGAVTDQHVHDVIAAGTVTRGMLDGWYGDKATVDRMKAHLAPQPLGNDANGNPLDDTANLQNAINIAQSTNGFLQLGYGTYNITTLATSAGFSQPTIRGRGMRYTTIKVTGSGNGIKFNGGSGQPGGGSIEDVTITGAAGTGVVFQGVNECYARRVYFKTLAVGVKFHNELLSNFTEFCVAEDCVWSSDVTLPVWYARSNAVESFHGSGFLRANLAAPSSTGPAVQIDNGCFVYGAPMDGTIFCRTNNQTLIVNNNTSRTQSVRGNLDFEVQQNATGVVAGGGTGGSIAYEGGIGILGPTSADFTFAKLFKVRKVLYTGATTFFEREPWVENKAIGTGTSDLITSGNIGACMMHVELNAANYNYVFTLLVWRDSFNGNTGGVTILATHKSLNTAGYGAPTFSYANGKVQITNSLFPATGVVAYVDVVPFNHDRSDWRAPQNH